MTATKEKTKCLADCGKPAQQKGFCRSCFATTGVAARVLKRAQNEKDDLRFGFKRLVRLRKNEDTKIIDAVLEKIESGMTFNALVIKALARYLKLPQPPEPKQGRPEVKEIEL